MGYNYIAPASGSGDSLWVKLGGAGANANDIELDTSQGVTGITATNPANTKLRQLLTQIAAEDFAGNDGIDGTKEWKNVLMESGGTISILQSFLNTATGRELFRELLEVNMVTSATDGGLKTAEITHDETEIDDFVELRNANPALTQKVQRTIHENFDLAQVIVGGVQVLRRWLTAAEFLLDDQAGNRKFAILVNGDIQTNQVVAGAPGAPNGDVVELFDTTGASRGFVRLWT